MRRALGFICFMWVWGVGWVALGGAQEVGAQEASAPTSPAVNGRVLFQEGRALYDAGDFLQAAQRFEASYAASGRADLLYNVYLAYRDANRLQPAADALRRYLSEVQDPPNRQALEARLRILDSALAARQQGEAGQGAVQADPDPAASVSPSPKNTSEREPLTVPSAKPDPSTGDGHPSTGDGHPSTGDGHPSTGDGRLAGRETVAQSGGEAILPWVLMAGGGALLASGVVTGVLASADRSALQAHCSPDTPCDPAWQSTRDRGQVLAVTTDVLIGTGLVAATAGVVWWMLSDDQEQAAEPTAGMLCLPGHCVASYRTRF